MAQILFEYLKIVARQKVLSYDLIGSLESWFFGGNILEPIWSKFLP
jgi:hypothetical protein